MENAAEDLGKRIARWTEHGELLTTAVPGLVLFRREAPTEPSSGMCEPSICLVARGASASCSAKTRMCMMPSTI